MSKPRMRPEFTCEMRGSPEQFFAALERSLRDAGAPCRGMLYGSGDGAGAILRRHERDQHFWSPALHLHLVPGDGATPAPTMHLHGRFSPSSPVWTAFLAIYLVLAIAAIGSGCYGGAQILMGDAPWAFVGVAIAALLAAFTYGAAFIGQGLGGEDMYELRAFVEQVVSPCSPCPPSGEAGAPTLPPGRVSA